MSIALMSGFYEQDGQTSLCVLQAVEASAKISEGQALTTITQHYQNRSETALEAIYRFPLSYDAVVTKFSARIGEAVVEGKLYEREQARKRYEKALDTGDSAMLLENNSPDVFDIAVGNIAPGEEAAVTIEYWQNLKAVDCRCRYVLPMVLAPRYLPAHLSELGTSMLPNLGQADYRLTFSAELDLGVNYAGVTSPSHDIKVAANEAKRPTVSLASPTLLDSDLILDIALHNETHDSYIVEEGPDGNFLWLKFTMDTETQKEAEPHEYIFVLDASGSMSGGKLTQAKRALSLCLRNLMEGDRFNLIAFGSNFCKYEKQSVPYNQLNLDAAEKWLMDIGEMGGTEILQPLENIFSKEGFGMAREVLLFTDGEVGNEREVIELVKNNATNTRFFPFGIDTAVNRSFIDGLARAGNGQPEYIYPGERIDDKVIRQFVRIGEVVVTDLYMEGSSANGIVNLHNASPATSFPALLYTNEEYAFCFDIGFRPVPETITVSGNIEGQAFRREFTLGHTIGWQGLSKRWAKERIAYLQEQRADGHWNKRDRWAKEVIDTSLQYGIISAYTAYQAQIERKDKLTGKRRQEIVPSALPSLWEDASQSSLSMNAATMFNAVGDAISLPKFALASTDMFLDSSKRLNNAFVCHELFDECSDLGGSGDDLGNAIKTAALKQKADGSFGDVKSAVRSTAYFVIGMLVGGQYSPYRNQVKKAAAWLLANADGIDRVWAVMALQLAVTKGLADMKKCAELVDKLAATLSNKDQEMLAQTRAGCWHEVFGLAFKDYTDDNALAAWVLVKV